MATMRGDSVGVKMINAVHRPGQTLASNGAARGKNQHPSNAGTN